MRKGNGDIDGKTESGTKVEEEGEGGEKRKQRELTCGRLTGEGSTRILGRVRSVARL